jgi:hypothetical protein
VFFVFLLLILFSFSINANSFFCSSNSQCNDGNPATIDLCVRPGQPDSGCTNLNCVPLCSSNSDCDDGDSLTVNICTGIGRCTAVCASVPVETFNDGICQEYETSCSVPNDCGVCYEKFSGCFEKNCIGNSCRNTISLGCCGNGICEFKEDFSNCSEDCKPRVLSLEFLEDFSVKKFFRGDIVFFKVKILADGVLVNDAELLVKGFFGEIKLFNDGKHGDGTAYDAVYANEYLIPREAEKGSYNIEFTVNFANVKKTVNKTLFLDPVVELNDISVPSEVFLGEEINLKFRTRKESSNVSAKIDLIASLQGTSKEFFSKSIESDEDGLVSFSYRTSFLDSPGVWVLNVKAEDLNGNIGVKDYFINVRNPSDTSFLNLKLVSDLNKSFSRGEKIDFNLFVSDELGVGISGAESFGTFSGKKFLFTDNNLGYYFYSFEIPFNSVLGKTSFLIESKKQVDGKIFSGLTEIPFDINFVFLNSELISPFNRSVEIGENVLFKVRITYPNGKPISGPQEIPASINGIDLNLFFVGDGFFEKKYSVKAEDGHILFFDINSIDLYGNKIMFSSEINVIGISVLFYLREFAIPLFSGIIIFLIFFFFTFNVYFKSKSKKKLIEKKQELMQEIKEIQKQYFSDGFLDKNSYEKAMIKLETELKDINLKLNEK